MSADLTQARTALRHWPQLSRVCNIELISAAAFSGAQVFRVTTDTHTYALRLWPPGLPLPRLRELHRFLAFLHQQGITQIAVPLTGDTGTLLESPVYSWQVEPWMPGCADFAQHPSDERLLNTIQLIARLHLAAKRYAPSAAGHDWFYHAHGTPDAVSERLAKLKHWNTARLRQLVEQQSTWSTPDGGPPVRGADLVDWFNRAAPAVLDELKSMQSVSVPLHPCLRDIWSEHVLFTGEQVTGIIDCGAARTENVASDLSRLLGSFLPDGGERWQRAIHAYSALKPLSQDELRLILVLDHSGVLLGALHWIERTAADPALAANPHAHARRCTLFHRLRHLACTITPV